MAHTVCDDIRADCLRSQRNLAIGELILKAVTAQHRHDQKQTSQQRNDKDCPK